MAELKIYVVFVSIALRCGKLTMGICRSISKIHTYLFLFMMCFGKGIHDLIMTIIMPHVSYLGICGQFLILRQINTLK